MQWMKFHLLVVIFHRQIRIEDVLWQFIFAVEGKTNREWDIVLWAVQIVYFFVTSFVNILRALLNFLPLFVFLLRLKFTHEKANENLKTLVPKIQISFYMILKVLLLFIHLFCVQRATIKLIPSNKFSFSFAFYFFMRMN